MSWREYGKDHKPEPPKITWSFGELFVITILVFATLAMLIK